jgi:hypothetical protein
MTTVNKTILIFAIVVAFVCFTIAQQQPQQSMIDLLPIPKNVKDALKQVESNVTICAQAGSVDENKLVGSLQAVLDSLKSNNVDISQGPPKVISNVIADLKANSNTTVSFDYLRQNLASQEANFAAFLQKSFASTVQSAATNVKTAVNKLKIG